MASVPKNWTDYEVIVDSVFFARHQEEGAWLTSFTVHSGDRWIEHALVQGPSPTPLASLAPGQTPRPSVTRSPSPTPFAVKVEGDVPISQLVSEDPQVGVQLTGNGALVGEGTVETLFIANASHIQAESIVIGTYLELFEDSELSATSNGTITLRENVALHFSPRAAVTSIPKLDLGLIGPLYDTLPAELVVDIGEVKIEDAVLDSLKLPLVRGRTLANCDKWVVNFEGEEAAKLGTRCEDGEIVGEAKLLADDELLPLRTLYVVKKVNQDDPTKKPGPNVGLIVGIVIAVVAVIAIIIVVVVIVSKRKGGGGPSSSDSISGVDA
jgi:hypothetical protein